MRIKKISSERNVWRCSFILPHLAGTDVDPPKIFWHLKQPESNSTVIRTIIVKHNCFEDAWMLLLVGQPRVTQDNFRALSSPNEYCISGRQKSYYYTSCLWPLCRPLWVNRKSGPLGRHKLLKAEIWSFLGGGSRGVVSVFYHSRKLYLKTEISSVDKDCNHA